VPENRRRRMLRDSKVKYFMCIYKSFIISDLMLIRKVYSLSLHSEEAFAC